MGDGSALTTSFVSIPLIIFINESMPSCREAAVSLLYCYIIAKRIQPISPSSLTICSRLRDCFMHV